MKDERRAFLKSVLTAGAGMALAGGALLAPAWAREEPEEGVSPPEDLMREHGVLNRILLIYDDTLCRLDGCGQFEPRPVNAAAGIIRRFIEQYHEKLEEDHLFPRFRQANQLVDLVNTLETQHRAGRRLTDEILALTTDATIKDEKRRGQLTQALGQFIAMYRPHEAREDTVLFPALRAIVPAREFEAMGEAFEKKEHELFGREGFEGVVAQVAALEKQLGLYDLAQFTPR